MKRGKKYLESANLVDKTKLYDIDEALDLVIYAFEHGNQGDLFVQKAPSVTIDTLAKAIKKLKKSDVPISYIGPRHGEKDSETLITKEEIVYAEDLGDYYRVSVDVRNMNYQKCASDAKLIEEHHQEYSSSNTKVLNLKETMEQQELKVEAIEVMVSTMGFDAKSEQQDSFQEQSGTKARRKIDLNDLSEEVLEDEVVEIEKMKATGSSVSYLA